MSAKDTTKVNTKDDLTSKLEVALWLAKYMIIGEFVLFAMALGIWVIMGAIGSVQIGEDNLLTLDVSAAKEAVNILLPITTANVGALVGYILGTANRKSVISEKSE